MHNRLLLYFTLCLFFLCSWQLALPQNYSGADAWVDSVFNSLSLREKIGQTMIIRSSSEGDEKYNNEIIRQIKEYNICGICFFKGSPTMEASLTNQWQDIAKTPMFISMDAEWGLEMRLKEQAMAFPKQLTLGAIKNDSMIYAMAAAIADQMKRIGLNLSFSPDIDINNNPLNPVINFRSFGEDKDNVARKGIMYMKGLQDNGVAAVAKHFPGHGDTDTDSHYSLPVISHTKEHLDSMELYPFKQLIENGVCGIMVAHLNIPALEPEHNKPTSLSKNVVSNMLRNELDFKGLTFTDGLEMKAISEYAEPGRIEALSAIAGNDIQLLPIDIDKAIEQTTAAVSNGELTLSHIDSSCKRILYAKYFLGLNHHSPVQIENINEDINSNKDKALRRRLYQQAITVIKNKDNILPLKLDSNIATACIIASTDSLPEITNMFRNYCEADFFYVNIAAKTAECKKIHNDISKKHFDRIVVIVSTPYTSTKNNFKISDDVFSMINNMSETDNSVLCILGSPYLATKISALKNFKAIMMGYEHTKDVFELTPQALFGAFTIDGQLPVSIGEDFPAMSSITVYPSHIISFPSEEQIEYQYGDFHIIDSLAQAGIKAKAYPGCQIFAIHNGNVIYDKCFGTFSYDNNSDEVKNTTVYDVASITKIAATTIAVMNLRDKNIIDIDNPLSDYVPFLKNTNKKNIILRETMAHQAGLISYIRFYDALEKDHNLYENKVSEDYSSCVAKNMYLQTYYDLHILDSICTSPRLSEKDGALANKSTYSDLGFVLIGKAIENMTLTPLDIFVKNTFYTPLGLSRTTYRPLRKIDVRNIAPTENDNTFRKQLVRGYVHDQTAAMMNGVAGHAGLFSTAKELGIIMQMLLQKGCYNNTNFFNETTCDEFTATQFPEYDNRKACGFDKPMLQYEKNGPACKSASPHSFGHSGFTGCYAWVDPDNNLVYVFVSNRINPDATNNKISKMNIRTDIHQELYNIIENRKDDSQQY